MTEDTRRDDGTVGGEEQIERICERFRRQLYAHRKPAIEDYLAVVPEPTRNHLLTELIAAEIYYRQRRGGTVEIAEYHERFPRRSASVTAAQELLERRHAGKPQPAGAAGRSAPGEANSADSLSGLVSENPLASAQERRRIAQFQLLEHLGEGRYGSVWKARDTKLDRTVAVKIPRQRAASQREVDLFFREARAVAQMRHPNIVSIYEIGREADTIFMATEFIQGVNLREFLDSRGPRSPEKAAEFCAKIADGLACAHEAGVIHRDLKPSNILVDVRGQPHVADFGLAKRQDVDLTLTVEGQVLGTPAYMSPEQADGQARSADHRTDIYALGVVLFELMTGELPYRGDRKMLIMQKLREPAPSPRQLNSRVARDLETICLRCLERDPTRRYPTCRELADDLRHFLAGEPIQARPINALMHAGRLLLRPRASSIAAGGYMVVLAFALLLWIGMGLLSLVFGGAAIKNEVIAMSQLSGLTAITCLPLLYCGVAVLTGKRRMLWLGVVVTCIGWVGSAAAMSGLTPEFLRFSFIQRIAAGGFFGSQLWGLLASLFTVGLLIDVIAIVRLRAEKAE